MSDTFQKAEIKPLIERLKAERLDLLGKHGKITRDVRHYRDLRDAAKNEADRAKYAKQNTCAAGNCFRVQDRLTELNGEITAENKRLAEAIKGIHASKKFARTGSIFEHQEENTTV